MKSVNILGKLKVAFTFSLIHLISFFNAGGQGTSFEFWPEVDMWYKITPGLRLSSFVSATRYFENDTRDLNISFQADHSFGNSKRFLFSRLLDQNRAEPLKVWLVRGGYMYGWSFDVNNNYTEDMLFAELHRRFLLKHNILFSQRLRMDNRWIGEVPVYSYRFRYRILFEREFFTGKKSVIPFVSAEPYWDSRNNGINRLKVVGGATLSWKSRFAFEGNVTYQYFSDASVTNVLALNAILHLYFETAAVRAIKK